MQNAKDAVAGFLGKNNHHSVDIEQSGSPSVAHERVQEARHENVTVAHDREIHQHHHQTHVQPIQDKVIEPEQHHHNIIPVEHRQHHHGKDAEVEQTLTQQAAQFRDETTTLPTQHSKSSNTVVGEHVHHHIHDTIQPVIERERLQQHVVHTTIPIHERIDKEPVIHSGNVLPTKTLAEFESAGHKLTGQSAKAEHIDYEGEPLKIREDSRVGFDHSSRHGGLGSTGAPGELGTNTGAPGTAGITGGSGLAGASGYNGSTGTTGTHTNALTGKTTAGPHDSNMKNEIDPRVDSDRDGRSGLTGGSGYNGTTGTTGTHTNALTGKTTAGPHDSNMKNEIDPRVDSDRDGRSGLTGGSGYNRPTGTTGTHINASDRGGQSGLTGGSGYNGSTGTTGTHTNALTGKTTAGPHDSNMKNEVDPRVDSDRDGRSGLTGATGTTGTPSGLGENNTSRTGAYNSQTTAEKPSTASKIMNKMGL